MPKASNSSSKSKSNSSLSKAGSLVQKLAIFKSGNERKVVPRQAIATYDSAILEAKKCLPQLAHRSIILQTDQLAVSEGEMVEITPSAWSLALEEVSTFYVSLSARTPVEQPMIVAPPPAQPQPNQGDGEKKVTLKVIGRNCNSFSIQIKARLKMSKVRPAVARQFGGCERDWRLFYLGSRIQDHDTVTGLGIADGDTIMALKEQRDGKPVIYLFSPDERESRVQLSLVPEWEFSAIYPAGPVKQSSKGQFIEWNVRTSLDGTMKDLSTGLDVAYLFWEAHTVSDPEVHMSSPPRLGQGRFIPSQASLTPSNSVLLSISDVPQYLDNSLLALGLHTEARTSFITYWLPSLLKHSHVALRYLPRTAYEHAAPLEVAPLPDVITRIFMLFKGIDGSDVDKWSIASQKSLADVAFWRDVVGVDLEKALDVGLFRVLEWGGMEILN